MFAAEWLAGKTHPITGEPLEIVELELPPGSIVSCLSVRSLFNSFKVAQAVQAANFCATNLRMTASAAQA